MKLMTTTHVSIDGVMQGLGAPDEDRRGGFERGGWAIPLLDDEAATFLDQVFRRADPQWADTSVLSRDVAPAIGELRAKPEGELQVQGSGALIDSQTTARGLIIQVYRSGGKPEYATATAD